MSTEIWGAMGLLTINIKGKHRRATWFCDWPATEERCTSTSIRGAVYTITFVEACKHLFNVPKSGSVNNVYMESEEYTVLTWPHKL